MATLWKRFFLDFSRHTGGSVGERLIYKKKLVVFESMGEPGEINPTA